MDIPLPDELEFLEANSHFYQDNLDPPSPDTSNPHPPEQDLHSPSQSPTESQTNGQNKRPRSNSPDPPYHEDNIRSDEKRSKIDDVGQEIDEEEDWLRYSPAQERNGGEEEEIVEVVMQKEKEMMVSRYASEIDGEFIPVTAPSSGDRVYAKLCRVDNEKRAKKLNLKSQSNGLISEPISVLLQRLEQEAFTKALQASSGGQNDVVLPEIQVMHEQLWVDKYAPNSFTELLSDEQTNREVLLWLKQWDSCVFKSEIRSTSDEVLSALRRHSSVTQHQKPSDSAFLRKNKGHKWTNGTFGPHNNLDQENSKSKGIHDSWTKKSRLTGPPEQKILLLCGPPGLGKTTLAHVAAKHCGYRVVEVNASDDRSSSTIETKILDVVQMNSVMADSRPKCLVIDEIDGALGDGKGAVEVLLKMVAADRKSDTGKENVAKGEQAGKISSKKGHKTTLLSRPVICICNDLYAPALRTLRQVAKVHIFVQPTVSRVVSRLKYICNKEGIKTSSIALTALADYTECDIRSCLNTLQFLHKKREALNVLEISSQVVGRKDISRSVFDIWKEIFQKRKTKQERKPNGSCGSLHSEFDSLLFLMSHRGDYDVIMDGIYENILLLQYHDPVMQKTVNSLNSLGISDVIHQYIMRSQNMLLHAYQPSLAITVHQLVAQVQKPNIEWPKSHQRYRTILMERMDKLRSWQNKILPHISRHLCTKSLVEDTISPLLHILSPPNLKPVALHLLTEREKNDLTQLVGTMVSYSMTYKNIKPDPVSHKKEHEAALDASSLSFDPPIYDFVNFKGYSSGHYALPLAVKQMLVHEVEKQKILQVSRSVHLTDACNIQNLDLVDGESGVQFAKINRMALFSGSNGKNNLNPGQCVSSGSGISQTTDSSKRAMSNVKLKSTGITKKPSSSSASFFDRFRKAGSKSSLNTDTASQKTVTLDRDSRPLLFKFNEGFTNAVKRPVRMREFIL